MLFTTVIWSGEALQPSNSHVLKSNQTFTSLTSPVGRNRKKSLHSSLFPNKEHKFLPLRLMSFFQWKSNRSLLSHATHSRTGDRQNPSPGCVVGTCFRRLAYDLAQYRYRSIIIVEWHCCLNVYS